MVTHRRSIWPVLALACGALASSVVTAQSYPTRPVRFIVSNSAGGSDDIHARMMAQKRTEVLGQQFVVDNRPGAGGLIGQQAVAGATPDGHTILLAGRSLTAAR